MGLENDDINNNDYKRIWLQMALFSWRC